MIIENKITIENTTRKFFEKFKLIVLFNIVIANNKNKNIFFRNQNNFFIIFLLINQNFEIITMFFSRNIIKIEKTI